MLKSKPQMIIIAGPNGSGKTTFGHDYLIKLKIEKFLNSDEIAKGLSPVKPKSQERLAGEILILQLRKYIKQKASFAIETTLSGKTLFNYIEQALNSGYETELVYLYTSDVNINIRRIKNRKKEGGHFVTSKDVRRRYLRSIENLNEVKALCDKISIYDAMLMPPEPLYYTDDEVIFQSDRMPKALKRIFHEENS